MLSTIFWPSILRLLNTLTCQHWCQTQCYTFADKLQHVREIFTVGHSKSSENSLVGSPLYNFSSRRIFCKRPALASFDLSFKFVSTIFHILLCAEKREDVCFNGFPLPSNKVSFCQYAFFLRSAIFALQQYTCLCCFSSHSKIT